ncbi:hypothetical protein DZB74_09390 [Bacillus sp. HMG]|nr:hypothetical protein DZB74_09390 [Bacillus sp. HMG]
MSVLCFGAHDVKFAPRRCSSFLGLQRFSITLKRRQRAKIKFILALCQQSGAFVNKAFFM